MISSKTTFWGYRRENGRVGVRNHVIILPVDDLSNAACEAVAHNIKGTMAIPHPYGRLQFGADLDLHFRTLIGAGANPNVAAVVVIGIEEGWTKRVVDGIAKTGKPQEKIIPEICSIIDGPISAEVTELVADKMLEQGKILAAIHENVVVKLPLTEKSSVSWRVTSGCARTTHSSPSRSTRPALNSCVPGKPFDGAAWRDRIASRV